MTNKKWRKTVDRRLTRILEKLKPRFNKSIKRTNLQGEQIYSCDETALFYRMLSDKILPFKDEKTAFGYKKIKPEPKNQKFTGLKKK